MWGGCHPARAQGAGGGPGACECAQAGGAAAEPNGSALFSLALGRRHTPFPPPPPRNRPTQEELAYALCHPAGLNPKAFRNRFSRAPRALAGGFSHTRPVAPGANCLLLGGLLWRYVGLDLRAQARVAAALGLGRHEVLADLRALSAATAFL